LNPVEFLLLIALGLGAGTYGTIIGAGGGFLMVPLLLLFYPSEVMTPATATGISLAVVFFNALSGGQAYARMRRIDYRTGFYFAVATVPSSILGRLIVPLIPRNAFKLIFGVFIIALATYLIFRPSREGQPWDRLPFTAHRRLVDASGKEYAWSFNLGLGLAINLLVGFVSSLLGVGGGIINVPAMVQLLNFPAHIATATSTFTLAFTSLTGTLTNLFAGQVTPAWIRVLPLSIGVIAGGQLGARLSRKMGGRLIVRLLGVALFLVAARLILDAVTS
jgi:uncharacterized membrane protein YfcA